jgi:hypothetical protein
MPNAEAERTSPPSNGFPFEVLSLERGESQDRKISGWKNTLIIKLDKRTGETWILTHIPGPENFLRWVLVKDHKS